MPFNLLLLPLLGGYIFVRYWNRTRFHVLRAEKDRLIIFASIAGLLTLIGAFFLTALVAPLFPCKVNMPCVPLWWRANVPFEYSGISFLAFLLGALGWYPLNSKWKQQDEIDRIIEEDKAPFEQMLKKAQSDTKTVSITMKSGKVYVGFAIHIINPARPIQFVKILPTKSGYRDPNTKWLHFTTFYSEALDKVAKDFEAKVVDYNNTRNQYHESIPEYVGKKGRDKQQVKARIAHLQSVMIELDREIAELSNVADDFAMVLPLSEIASMNIYSAYIHAQYFPPAQEPES